MIKLFTIDNLVDSYANVPVINGNISGERNGYHKLSFSILSKYLKQQNIVINQKTIFQVDGLFYVCTDAGNSDVEKIELSYNAELLQTQILMFKFIDTIELTSTSIVEVLSLLVNSTILEAGDCDNISSFDFQISKNNAQYALSQLLEITKTEVTYNGLKINIKKANWQDDIKTLTKGYDFTTLDESTDVSDVITKLHYKNTKGDLSGFIVSSSAGKYGFTREGYQEFDADDIGTLNTLSKEYLATIDQPSCSISISIPKVRKLNLSLCELVKLHNTLLDEELIYKVVGYNKSLTTSADTYQLGQRKKDFTDIEQLFNEKAQEVVQEVVQNVIVEVIEQEVISANTAHILNAWIRDLNVEFLETNFEALDVRQPYPEDGLRNFIRIKEEQMEFVTQSLSETEVQDYHNKDEDQLYYTAIDDHVQAYKYFTITSPTSIYQDLTEEQVNKFKVKTRKILSESIKATFTFGLIGDTQYPLMRWGVGTDPSGSSDKGKGFIYKELDGLVLKYVTSTGTTHQIKLGENGIEGIEAGGGETIIQNINMGGLIEIPGVALTKASFSESGVSLEHGEIKTTFTWTKDSAGRITTLYNSQTGLTVPVSWS